jgi:membrane protein DedA with SNARE-associated domain
MAIESSIAPLPSELVIPPAAYLAMTTGQMTLPGLVVAGAIGSWCGASLMYWMARALGRPLLLRFGRYVLITPTTLEAAERWSARFGPFGVFAARLLPVIRHLIGIPVGIVRMPFVRYSAVTLLGSAVWTAVLCWVGVTAGRDPAVLAGDLHRITVWCVAVIAALAALYWMLVRRHMRA